jgi:hypothetical protein
MADSDGDQYLNLRNRLRLDRPSTTRDIPRKERIALLRFNEQSSMGIENRWNFPCMIFVGRYLALNVIHLQGTVSEGQQSVIIGRISWQVCGK